jgi:hypothetical protein
LFRKHPYRILVPVGRNGIKRGEPNMIRLYAAADSAVTIVENGRVEQTLE